MIFNQHVSILTICGLVCQSPNFESIPNQCQKICVSTLTPTCSVSQCGTLPHYPHTRSSNPQKGGIKFAVFHQTSKIKTSQYFLQRRPSSRLCMVVILIIWLISMVIWVPIIAKFEIHECVILTDGTYSCTCREDWSHRFQFTIFSLVLQYLLPATVITYCYCRVLAALRKRSEAAKARNSPGSGLTPSTIHALKEQQELKRNHRVTMMLIAMVSLFLVLWLPLNVINLADDFVGFPGHSRTWNYFFRLIFITADLVSMYSTVCNPFLYAYMKEDLRKAFENLLNPCMRKNKNSSWVVTWGSDVCRQLWERDTILWEGP